MTTATAKKPTLATLKSFVRKNRDKLLVRQRAWFDGMIDGMRWTPDSEFQPASEHSYNDDSTLGIKGVCLVGGSRNYIQRFEDERFVGFEVSNCCADFTLAIRK